MLDLPEARVAIEEAERAHLSPDQREAGMRRMARNLWVPQTPHTSCDLLILVEQSTEPVAPSDACCRARRSPGEWS